MPTFRGGVHYCLGAHLARVELADALRVITACMSNPHCSGPAPWKAITELQDPQHFPSNSRLEWLVKRPNSDSAATINDVVVRNESTESVRRTAYHMSQRRTLPTQLAYGGIDELECGG
jgi:hypothetical protein